jgi:hypothetical protein
MVAVYAKPWQACPMQKCSSFFFFFLLSKHDAHGPVQLTSTGGSRSGASSQTGEEGKKERERDTWASSGVNLR